MAESGFSMKPEGGLGSELIRFEVDSARIKQDKKYLSGGSLNCQYYMLVRDTAA